MKEYFELANSTAQFIKCLFSDNDSISNFFRKIPERYQIKEYPSNVVIQLIQDGQIKKFDIIKILKDSKYSPMEISGFLDDYASLNAWSWWYLENKFELVNKLLTHQYMENKCLAFVDMKENNLTVVDDLNSRYEDLLKYMPLINEDYGHEIYC